MNLSVQMQKRFFDLFDEKNDELDKTLEEENVLENTYEKY